MSFFSTKTRNAANCATKSAVDATRYARHDLRRAHDHARDDALHAAEDMRQELARAANRTERRVQRFANDVYSEIEGRTGQIAGQIRSNPIKSVVALLTAGFLIGSIYNLNARRR